MSLKKYADIEDEEYVVTRVEKTDPPDGLEGTNWCEYVLTRGNSTIEGKRRGTVSQVRRQAEEIAEDVNSRSGIKGKSIWAPRKSK
jgi:hypothetical protein